MGKEIFNRKNKKGEMETKRGKKKEGRKTPKDVYLS